MKKTIAILLVLCLCIPLCACTSKTDEVEINIENWDNYFKIETTVEDFEYDKKPFLSSQSGTNIVTSASATLHIRIYRKVDCKVKDVSFKLGLFPYREEWNSYDFLDYVTLSEDGCYEGSFRVTLKPGAEVTEMLPFSPFKEPGYSVLLGDLKGCVLVPKG